MYFGFLVSTYLFHTEPVLSLLHPTHQESRLILEANLSCSLLFPSLSARYPGFFLAEQFNPPPAFPNISEGSRTKSYIPQTLIPLGWKSALDFWKALNVECI